MEDTAPQRAQKWLEDRSKPSTTQGIESRALDGLQVLHAQKGLIQCNFVIPKHLSDGDGNWHVGAMATLIDCVGAAAICSFAGHIKASVNLDISYYSTAKIQEEVEVNAKVLGGKGKLALVVVKIKMKLDGRMVALSKQWMASINIVPNIFINKSESSQVSKL